MRRRRWRTTVLWGGCTLCVLIVVLFVVSGWWEATVQLPGWGKVAAGGGQVGIFMNFAAASGIRRHEYGLSNWNDFIFFESVTFPTGNTVRTIVIPLYSVFLAVAVPTLLVWRFWPKPVKPGHCLNCDYNLTGLTEPRCPECGQPFEVKGDVP